MRRKLEALGRWDPQTADVANWILRMREQGNEFAKRVELPAILNVTVRDSQRYAAAVETCMSAAQQRVCLPVHLGYYALLSFNRPSLLKVQRIINSLIGFSMTRPRRLIVKLELLFGIVLGVT
jgi:hypothetical protein